MKTLPCLLLLLAGSGACSSPSTREPTVERVDEARAWTVIPLQHADAPYIAQVLEVGWPEVQAIADQRTNSVLLTCRTPAGLLELKKVVAELDLPATASAATASRRER